MAGSDAAGRDGDGVDAGAGQHVVAGSCRRQPTDRRCRRTTRPPRIAMRTRIADRREAALRPGARIDAPERSLAVVGDPDLGPDRDRRRVARTGGRSPPPIRSPGRCGRRPGRRRCGLRSRAHREGDSRPGDRQQRRRPAPARARAWGVAARPARARGARRRRARRRSRSGRPAAWPAPGRSPRRSRAAARRPARWASVADPRGARRRPRCPSRGRTGPRRSGTRRGGTRASTRPPAHRPDRRAPARVRRTRACRAGAARRRPAGGRSAVVVMPKSAR